MDESSALSSHLSALSGHFFSRDHAPSFVYIADASFNQSSNRQLKMAGVDDVTSESSPLLRSNSSTLQGEGDDIPTVKAREGLSIGRGVLISFAMWLLIFILTCNVSLMTTIQGSIATELDAFDAVSWFTSSYLIAVTSLIPVAGRLSIIFTPRYYLFASIVVESAGLLITLKLGPSLSSSLAERSLGLRSGYYTSGLYPRCGPHEHASAWALIWVYQCLLHNGCLLWSYYSWCARAGNRMASRLLAASSCDAICCPTCSLGTPKIEHGSRPRFIARHIVLAEGSPESTSSASSP